MIAPFRCGHFVSEPLESRRLLAAQMIGDLDPRTGDSTATAYTSLNGTTLFYANSKLYRTDSTAAGTLPLATLNASVDHMEVLGNAAYFTESYRIWKTDGTKSGTVLLTTLPPVTFGAPTELQAVNGNLYFKVSRSLYSLNPDTLDLQKIGSYYGLSNLAEYKGEVYYGATDNLGSYLYRTNGTVAGTVLVKQIDNSAAYTPFVPEKVTASNGLLYFVGSNAAAGVEPWRSDGTSAGTYLLKDLAPGNSHSAVAAIVGVNGSTLLLTYDGLYATNGTTTTSIRSDVRAITQTVTAVTLNSVALFNAYTSGGGSHLYRSDGTANGTYAVESLSSLSYSPQALTLANGKAYFVGYTTPSVANLYKTDGTIAGTAAITQAVAGGTQSFIYTYSLTGTDSRLYFSASDTVLGTEPFVSDGTAAGTKVLADLNTTPYNSDPGGPYPGVFNRSNDVGKTQTATIGNIAYFGTADGSLWKTNGTAVGTTRVTSSSAYYGYSSGDPIRHLTAWNGHVYFVTSDGFRNQAVWRSDGTAAGTVKVISGFAGREDGQTFVPFQDKLYYFVNGSLYASAPGAVNATLVSSAPFDAACLTATTDALYFRTNNAGYELWKSDGTTTGTVSFVGKSVFSGLRSFVASGSTLYFIAIPSGSDTAALYRTGGTLATTALIKSVASSKAAYDYYPPSFLTVMNGVLYFAGTDDANGTELWRSDGTAAGTTIVADCVPGAVGGSPQFLTAIGNRLYFLATTADSGSEPWISDGTTAGTRRLADLNPGPTSSLRPYPISIAYAADNPFMPAPDGSVLITADDGTHGVELYRITLSGNVVLAADVNAGAASSEARPISVITPPGSTPTLLFSAADPIHGRELWSFPLPTGSGLPSWLVPSSDAAYLFSGISLQVTAGTMTLLADAAIAGAGFAVSVSGTAHVVFNTSQHLGTLMLNDSSVVSVAGGEKVLRVTGLTIGVSSRLDLNDSALIYDYSTAGPQADAVRQLIGSARAGGAWTGYGLTSTAAKNRAGRGTTLGYTEASDYKTINGANATFDGQAIDSTAVLVRYTLYGDADFNRRVDFNDFLRLQVGFNRRGTTFIQGDFDYNGTTNFNDFLLLQVQFNRSLTVPPQPVVTTALASRPPATASLSGVAFNDTNRNGRFDAGETVAAGKTVWLDLDDDGLQDRNEASAVTDSRGRFGFKNLAAGKYHVRRAVPAGYVESTPARYITLGRGQSVGDIRIGSRAK
ncbi:MAG TPA: ELWxxDGT repeat protein [Tepidisphaeraceae bacterium]